MTEAQRRRYMRKARRELMEAAAFKKAIDRFFAALYRARRRENRDTADGRPPCRCGSNCGQC